MPGSPPTKDREPVTIPPPRTLSSSPMPVGIRSSLFIEISDIFIGEAEARLGFAPPFFVTDCFSSTKVFHDLQAGHCPSHLDDSCPQSLQKKTVFAFAISVPAPYCFFTRTMAVMPGFSSTLRISLPPRLAFMFPTFVLSIYTRYSCSGSTSSVT